MRIHIGTCHGECHQIYSFMWTVKYWIPSHSKIHLEQMMKEFIEEAERSDLEPDETYSNEKMEDVMIETKKKVAQISVRKSIKILGYQFNLAGKMQNSLEERVQGANKARWRDAKIYRSKDVPWRVTCRRMVDQVDSFPFRERKLVLEQSEFGQNQRLGDKSYEAFFLLQKEE